MKPAYEPIILARKPGPMRELGIEECRIGRVDGDRTNYGLDNGADAGIGYHGLDGRTPYTGASGRWPANLILECTCDETREGTVPATARPNCVGKPYGPDGGIFALNRPVRQSSNHGGANGKEPVRIHTDPNCPCAMLDGQTGNRPGAVSNSDSGSDKRGTYSKGWSGVEKRPGHADSGGASRFFYCAKASRSERNAGCEGMEERPGGALLSGDGSWSGEEARGRKPRHDTRLTARNHHPTVKPLALMRWLVKLVAQPGDVVLDPFMGSGTTGVACAMEGREFIGIEREAEYIEIARRRIEAASAQERLPV